MSTSTIPVTVRIDDERARARPRLLAEMRLNSSGREFVSRGQRVTITTGESR
jgi:hypothetical protein